MTILSQYIYFLCYYLYFILCYVILYLLYYIYFISKIIFYPSGDKDYSQDIKKPSQSHTIFPDKTYREVQKTYAKMGTVESTIAAFLGMYMCMLCILQ